MWLWLTTDLRKEQRRARKPHGELRATEAAAAARHAAMPTFLASEVDNPEAAGAACGRVPASQARGSKAGRCRARARASMTGAAARAVAGTRGGQVDGIRVGRTRNVDIRPGGCMCSIERGWASGGRGACGRRAAGPGTFALACFGQRYTHTGQGWDLGLTSVSSDGLPQYCG